MNYSLSYTLGNNGRGADPSAARYIAAVRATGATVDSNQVGEINTFYKAAKTGGYYTSLKRLYLPIWGVAAANAIDMIGLTSGTFNGGVTHGAGFVQGDGTTGYLNTGVAPATLGMTLSSIYIFGLQYTAPTAGFRSIAGAGFTDPVDLFSNEGVFFFRDGGNTNSASGAGTGAGIFSASKTSGNTAIYKRITSGRSVIDSRASGDELTLTLAPFYHMALNTTDLFSAGNPAVLSDAQLGAYGLGVGFSSGYDTAFTLHLKTLWENCTGLALP